MTTTILGQSDVSFLSVVQTSVNYTANPGDLVLVDATAAAVTITLPAPNVAVKVSVKKTDSTANAVNIVGTVDGVTNASLTVQNQSIHLTGDGSGYCAVGGAPQLAVAAGASSAAGMTVTDAISTANEQIDVPWIEGSMTASPTMAYWLGYSGHNGAQHMQMLFGNKATDGEFAGFEWADDEKILIFYYGASGAGQVGNYMDASSGILYWASPIAINCAQGSHAGTSAGALDFQMPFIGGGYKKLILTLSAYSNGNVQQVQNLQAGGYGLNYQVAFSQYVEVANSTPITGITLSNDGSGNCVVTIPAYTGVANGLVIFEGY